MPLYQNILALPFLKSLQDINTAAIYKIATSGSTVHSRGQLPNNQKNCYKNRLCFATSAVKQQKNAIKNAVKYRKN